MHPPANKIGVLVRVKGSDAAAARRLAMHISFAAPRYRSVDEVPADELANERSIYENQADVQSKPEEVRAKIVEGRLRKEFLSGVALSEQSWIHDPSLTAGKALAGGRARGARVRPLRARRVTAGERVPRSTGCC